MQVKTEVIEMDYYYVNNKAQSNGDHEVHKETCQYIPGDKTYLGFFSSCHDAVKEARKKYTKSNGCKFCSLACHTS